MGNQNSKDEEQTQLLFQIQQQLIKNQIEIQKLKQNPNPQSHYNEPIQSFSLNEILKNPELQQTLKNHPERRKVILEQLLKQYSHLMTREQVEKMRKLIFNEDIKKPSSLPPTSLLPFIPPTDNRSITISSNQLSNYKTSNELTHHYETQTEREQREFEEEQERRKQEFISRQRERRKEYETKLNEFEGQNIDALKLFDLSSNYTIDALKTSYKKLALKNHPDKPGGNAAKFEFITKCYFLLLERLKKDTSHHQSQRQNTTTNTTSNNDFTPSTSDIKQAKENFNIRKFNEIFEKHKLYDPNEEGYDDWLKNNEKTQSQPVFSAKFNIDVFNSTFDNWKTTTPSTNQNTSITSYEEPQALVSCNTIGFTDIDNTVKKPFTRHQETSRDLSYCDLKGAYTSDNTLINPNSVSYKTYKNVDELERDRSNISFKLSPEDEYRIARKKQQDEEAEELRRQRIYQRDTIVEQTYSKTHQQMLGFNRNDTSTSSSVQALPAPVHPRNIQTQSITYNPNPNQQHIPSKQIQNKDDMLYIKY